MGALEYFGSTVQATVGQTDMGSMTRWFPTGARGGVQVAYVTTAGGAGNTTYDNKIHVVRQSDFSVIASSTAAPGPILSYTYYRRTAVPYGMRLFAVVDSDGDGQGDCIMAFMDDGTNITADTTFDGGGDGMITYANGIGTLAVVRLLNDGDTEANGSGGGFADDTSDQTTNRRLFFAAGGMLYKVNVDASDDALQGDNGDEIYGGTIWTKNDYVYEGLGAINYVGTTEDLFVSVSGASPGPDSPATMVVKMTATVNGGGPAITGKRTAFTTSPPTGHSSNSLSSDAASKQELPQV